jgi:hypothetical protein
MQLVRDPRCFDVILHYSFGLDEVTKAIDKVVEVIFDELVKRSFEAPDG